MAKYLPSVSRSSTLGQRLDNNNQNDQKVVVSCFCGRSAPDSLAHYLICPRLWRAICSACSVPLFIDSMSAIALPNLSRLNVRLACIAFVVYHKFKGEYPAEFGDPSNNIQRTAALVKSVTVLHVALLSFGWQVSICRRNL